MSLFAELYREGLSELLTASGSSDLSAPSEKHYAAMYAQDGAWRIEIHEKEGEAAEAGVCSDLRTFEGILSKENAREWAIASCKEFDALN